MSKHKIAIKVNNSGAASGLRLGDCVVAIKHDHPNPIDLFNERLTEILISLGKVPSDLKPMALSLFYIGMISATEKFFRDLVCGVVSICQLAKDRLRDSSIQFGTLGYYTPNRMASGIFQGKSLSDLNELKTLIRKIGGCEIKQGDEITVALEEFSSICQVRHALVHSYGELGLNNLTGMGLESPKELSEVLVDDGLFQSSAVVCNNLVKVVNQSIFEAIVSEWIDQSKLKGVWKEDKMIWDNCWSVFRSKDQCDPKNSYQAWMRIKGAAGARSQGR